MQFTQRSEAISPFHVMDVLAKAKVLESIGRKIIHMEVGEPDFVTPQPIVEAGITALRQGKTHYTPALGLPALREAIAAWYESHYGVSIAAERVVITPGASGALLLVMGALLEKDKQVMLADPGYPCNRNFARFVEGRSLTIPVSAETNYQLTADAVKSNWTDQTAMALIASPSNPTGSIIEQQQLVELSSVIKEKKGHLIVDEIYHGLTYDGVTVPTVLEIDQNAFVINSFSKFFGMTGWRLGWLIAPESAIDVMDRLAQNLFLAAPTVAQYAALAAFEQQTLDILEQRRQCFEQRRNILLPALQSIGFDIPVTPQGAFYLYADCSSLLNSKYANSTVLAEYLLNNAGVAITPGNDFGTYQDNTHVRFAYTTDEATLYKAVDKIKGAMT